MSVHAKFDNPQPLAFQSRRLFCDSKGCIRTTWAALICMIIVAVVISPMLIWRRRV